MGGEFNPLALGTTLDSNVSSSSVTATAILSNNFVVDGVFGFTRQHTYQQPPGPVTCWGEELGIPNSCQPGQRDYVLPRIDITGWSSYGNGVRPNDNTGSVFDYLDPQYQYVANATYTKGAHNLKFGADVHRLHMNHYEVTSAFFGFTGGATALSGGAAPNLYNSYADFLLGVAVPAAVVAADAALERGRRAIRIGRSPCAAGSTASTCAISGRSGRS